MLRILLLITLWCAPVWMWAQQHKELKAVKARQALRIDGVLDDEAWQAAPVISDFIQNFPKFGDQPSARSEVRILYDNSAIYIGAYLYDDPALIRRQITSRDGESRQDCDYFSVFFDTYNDQQNGFQFLVTPANVQTDARIGGGGGSAFGDFGDKTWDAVWESQVKIRENGWVVEMRIPYLSLRFSKKDVQTWGLQVLRYFRRTNENDYWNPVNPNINGFANQFGRFTQLEKIEPPLRLSFSPYLSGGVRVNPDGSPIKTQWLRNGGMDVKYGINESFTLDATLIPDFGQVVSDNIVNNLSPFEVRFKENRPFFTEGTELFNKSGLFYSRRIGAVPGGYYAANAFGASNPDYELVKNPSMTQLYNGIKFSGRTPKKLGIGFFNALTAPMQARFRNRATKSDTVFQTEPMSNYNLIVLDQALRGRSSVTFTNTNVLREGTTRDANVSAFDWSLYSVDNLYRFSGTARYSKVFGNTLYRGNEINLFYDTVRIGGRLMVKPYDGYNTTLNFGKVSGRWQWSVGNNITSNTYDPNDLGYIQSANKINYNGAVSYTQFTPTDRFIQYSYSLSVGTNYLYKPYRFSEVEVNAFAYWVFKNFWDVNLGVNTYPVKQHDYFELRTPGFVLVRPAEVTFSSGGSSDSRKRLFGEWSGRVALRDAKDNGYNQFTLGSRYRFSNRVSMSINYTRQYEQNQRGYSFQRESTGEPIAAFRNYTESVLTVSGVFNITSRLNLTSRMQHYWNKVLYQAYFNTNAKGDLAQRPFLAGNNENYNGFTFDNFLTWDFRLGSRMILGWKNWLGDSYAIDGAGNNRYLQNFGKTFSISHGNELTVRFIYFLDFNQLRASKKG